MLTELSFKDLPNTVYIYSPYIANNSKLNTEDFHLICEGMLDQNIHSLCLFVVSSLYA